METSKNYEDIIKALTVFDACLSEVNNIPKAPSTKKYGKLISKLINAEITGTDHGIDEYIMQIFHAFVRNKKKICVRIRNVVQQVEDQQMINNVIINPEMSKWNENDTKSCRRTNRSNIIQPQIIELFANTKQLDFILNDPREPHENIYTISVTDLIAIIESTSIEKVKMTIVWNQEEGESWLKVLDNLYGQELHDVCKEKGFTIKYEIGGTIERLTISKLVSST